MLTENHSIQIERFIQETFPEVYIVDLFWKEGSTPQIILRVDRDGGIDMGTCTTISRKLKFWLSEQELIEDNYRLEVSSPGVGVPLKLQRQYANNIGRTLSVTLINGSTTEGKLNQVAEDHIALAQQSTVKKKKNDLPEPDLILPFDQIKEAKVIIVF